MALGVILFAAGLPLWAWYPAPFWPGGGTPGFYLHSPAMVALWTPVSLLLNVNAVTRRSRAS